MVQFCLKRLYQRSKTVDKCLWPRMVKVETDCALKEISSLFYSHMCSKTIILYFLD